MAKQTRKKSEPTRRTVLCFPGDPDLELKPDANWKGKPLKSRVVAGAVIGASADGNTPWQIALADYEVRDGGIYLRGFNVRVAKFAANSYAARVAIGRALDSAYNLSQSEKAAIEKLPKLRGMRGKTVTVRGKKYWRAAKEFVNK